MNCFSAREGGFSLVELMVAVGIIGVMSSVAVPKYQRFRANAAQAEAQATLSSLYTLQQLYYTENDHYGKYVYTRTGPGEEHTPSDQSTDSLKFTPPKNARYFYTGLLYNAGKSTAVNEGATAVSFKIMANSQEPLGSCVGETSTTANSVTTTTKNEDKWCINENKVLTNDRAAEETPCVDADVLDGGC